MRFRVYAGASMVLATGVVIRALHERANFYSACIYVAQSNACLMILTNLFLLAVGTFMFALQRLLYGPLRPSEAEQLYEKAWFAITETCLAMTIFREEIGGWFLVMFVSLLVGKVWGWIGEGRVEILEQQPPANPRLFHARLSSSLALSLLFDSYLLRYSIFTVRQQARPNMMVMFAFEFAVLTVTSMSTAARYAISLYEASVVQQQTRVKLQERREQVRRERERAAARSTETHPTPTVPPEEEVDELDIDVPGWEAKGRWVFYLDLATDFLKLVLYITFFCVLCIFYGMPIHIIRDVAMTIRSFYKRISDFIKYRHATRDMNERYPDATAEEISSEDVCIICREGMRPWQSSTAGDGNAGGSDERLRPKKLPCGHILHFACLRSWLERQQNCPTCRQPVLAPPRTARTVPTPTNNGQAAGPQAPNAIANVRPVPVPPDQGRPAIPQNRIRYFNLGPLRFGFGAGRNLHGLGQVGANQAGPPVRPQDGGAYNDEVARLDFSFGFGDQDRANPIRLQHHPSATGSFQPTAVQMQLHRIEQQLMQEINSLRAQTEQLNLVRALQGELARIRIAQAAPAALAAGQFGNPPIPMPGIPSVQAFVANQQQGGLGAGHESLPPGLVLPEGWTLMPLHRLGAGTVPTQAPRGTASPPRIQGQLIPMAAITPSFFASGIPPVEDATTVIPDHATRAASTANQSGIRVVAPAIHHHPRQEGDPGDPGPSGSTAIPRTEQTAEGSSSAVDLPQWGSGRLVRQPRTETPPSRNSDGQEEDEEKTASSAERSAAKGKGRATTVEDAEDED